MGFFSKKKDKVYSLQEAMKLLQTAKYNNYTTIPVGNCYRLVKSEEALKEIQDIKRRKSFMQARNEDFLGRIKVVNSPYESNLKSQEISLDKKQLRVYDVEKIR